MNYLEKFHLHGKTAIISDGGGLLGRQFCKGLLDAGSNVAVVDIKLDVAKETALDFVRIHPNKVHAFQCDLSNEISVQNMVDEVSNHFGRIHILHNDAAGKSNYLDKWKEIMSVNLDGMFLVAKHVGKHMISNGVGGSIIQTFLFMG
ncbi:SDR family NAD(P)-dependent oxidoreductase [Chryseomicrobium palamuruense]|uniref:SDR family NAD(P)-dependent oxidoreductase n=1 Tax=Chryseomicrobium palamuruense TaxID=682973 RepID=A0ABV8UTP7_9BACL